MFKLLKLKIQIWIWEMFCNLIDYVTMDLVTKKSWVKKNVPAPGASAGPSAPPDNHGCYIEDDRTRQLRETYAAKRQQMTAWEIAHAQEAWEGHKAAHEANGRGGC